MPALFTPTDGRLTSQNILAGPLNGGEVMEIVSPGNAAAGNTYQVTTSVLAAFFAAFPFLNTEFITSGATIGSPYLVQTTDTVILFNKILGSASYTTLPLASSMAYPLPILFKDLKGDAATHNITIQFTGGQLCDGLSTISILNAYGWTRIAPIIGGTGWYQC
jgi:hypothetical protein